jgi:CheY-like chemotaxis protein
MNLVINASEALGDRNGTIRIATSVRHVDRATLLQTRLSPDLPPGPYAHLEVSDDGCGMNEATLARIFDPFFSTKFTGRGLGLAAVLGIVRGHGGAINITSALNQGTTFTLLFPVLDPTRALCQPKARDESAEPKWRGAGTILVADDEEAVRSVTARMLKSFGFEVVLAANGQDCLDQFRAAPSRFVVVLLDLTMPHLNGEDALRELRSIRPDIPVLLMSGFTAENVRLGFDRVNPNGFLQKPFKPEDLRESLRSILGPPALSLPPVDRRPEPGCSDLMPRPFLHLP